MFSTSFPLIYSKFGKVYLGIFPTDLINKCCELESHIAVIDSDIDCASVL